MRYPLYLGCTLARHRLLGIDAVINARAGQQHLNAVSREETECTRDAQAIRDCVDHRVRWYGPNSKFFRRHRKRIKHLISDRED